MKSTHVILLGVCIVALVLLGYFVSVRVWTPVTSSPVEEQSLQDVLVVRGQEISDAVTVERVVLSQAGFVVLRSSDGKRIGQIIEISPYLAAGAYEDVEVSFGDFYEYAESDQPIVMIYQDDGDKTFTGLDEPATNDEGVMSGVFVQSGAAVPSSVFAQQVAPSDGMSMETVLYTNAGFSPAHLTVPVGTMIEFVNKSDADMWVASNVHPSHEVLPTFDQFTASGKGTSYMYTFDQKGTWQYHDHINPALEGIIVVE